jgi:hypothetical protein
LALNANASQEAFDKIRLRNDWGDSIRNRQGSAERKGYRGSDHKAWTMGTRLVSSGV